LTDRPQALSQGDQALGVEEERPFHATFEVVAQEIEAPGWLASTIWVFSAG
jgi:hypothetical protein